MVDGLLPLNFLIFLFLKKIIYHYQFGTKKISCADRNTISPPCQNIPKYFTDSTYILEYFSSFLSAYC